MNLCKIEMSKLGSDFLGVFAHPMPADNSLDRHTRAGDARPPPLQSRRARNQGSDLNNGFRAHIHTMNAVRQSVNPILVIPT